ncbi:nuclease-related domain-containing protein [Cellulomonas aerilata]|uniref:nuclease-related domain-containing protein n=1 Tax=Cellulomonas aerilata TaxID=515326 RepID=UPI0011BE965B
MHRAEEQVRRWSAGAEGERRVASALPELSGHGWTALHDVRWPGRPKANLDHVALGPGGVVVIDAKNWTGSVTVANAQLRQNGYGRTREVEGVADAASALTALLDPRHRMAVRGVLCLAGQDVVPFQTPQGVTVLGLGQLVPYLDSLPPRLTPYDVADIGRHLTAALDSPRPSLPQARRGVRASSNSTTDSTQQHRRLRQRIRTAWRVVSNVITTLWLTGMVLAGLSAF